MRAFWQSLGPAPFLCCHQFAPPCIPFGSFGSKTSTKRRNKGLKLKYVVVNLQEEKNGEGRGNKEGGGGINVCLPFEGPSRSYRRSHREESLTVVRSRVTIHPPSSSANQEAGNIADTF